LGRFTGTIKWEVKGKGGERGEKLLLGSACNNRIGDFDSDPYSHAASAVPSFSELELSSVLACIATRDRVVNSHEKVDNQGRNTP